MWLVIDLLFELEEVFKSGQLVDGGVAIVIYAFVIGVHQV